MNSKASLAPGPASKASTTASHLVRRARYLVLASVTNFDTTTIEGRSKERYRRAGLTSVSSLAARGMALVAALVSVPLTIRYLGAERYGLWMTMSSVITLMIFSDLGISTALLNAVSRAHGTGDRVLATQYVSSAFFLLAGLAVTLAIGFAVIYSHVPWPGAFNVHSAAAAAEAGPAMAVIFACFAAGLPLATVQRVQMGYQRGFASNLWQIGGSVLAIGGLLIAMRLKASLPWLVLALTGAPVATMLGNWVQEFVVSCRWLFPRWRLVQRRTMLDLLRTGALFLGLQVAVAVAFSPDNLIASHFLGPQGVARYSVAQKLFMVSPTLAALTVLPLWPAYGEALSRRELSWVRRTLIRSVALALVIGGLPGVLLVLFAPVIFSLIAGPTLVPSFALASGFAVWGAMYACGGAISILLNAANVIRFQLMVALLMALASIGLKVVWARTFGIAGIIWATAVAYGCLSLLPTALFLTRRFRREWRE